MDQKFQMKNQHKTLFPLISVLSDSYLIQSRQMQASLSLQDAPICLYYRENSILDSCFVLY